MPKLQCAITSLPAGHRLRNAPASSNFPLRQPPGRHPSSPPAAVVPSSDSDIARTPATVSLKSVLEAFESSSAYPKRSERCFSTAERYVNQSCNEMQQERALSRQERVSDSSDQFHRIRCSLHLLEEPFLGAVVAA